MTLVAITAPPTKSTGKNIRMGKAMAPVKFIRNSPDPSAYPAANQTAAVETALGHSLLIVLSYGGTVSGVAALGSARRGLRLPPDVGQRGQYFRSEIRRRQDSAPPFARLEKPVVGGIMVALHDVWDLPAG